MPCTTVQAFKSQPEHVVTVDIRNQYAPMRNIGQALQAKGKFLEF
jgi:hypothetical protein